MILLLLRGALAGAVLSGTSLLYATLGEIVGERAGIVNLGLEGLLLVSAATSFAVTAATGSAALGVAAAAAAGALFNLLFGYLVITRRANQLASGLAMMFFGSGLSALIGRAWIGAQIQGLPRIAVPWLADLPWVRGTTLFRYDALVYLVVPLAAALAAVLFRTRRGLGLRAVGENPTAAFAAGWQPQRVQYQALAAGGAIAGLGAAHLAVAFTLTWSEAMTGGKGFIAIALVIFSKWHPLRAIVGALLFGGAEALQLQLQAGGAAVSPFVMDMTPYLLTLLVLVAWGRVRRFAAPAGLGRAFQGTE